jgi:hypothetical protein
MNKKIKENNKAFQLLSENFPNKRLRIKMLDLGNEYPEYAADELLLLSEEILSQVSAYGVCLYLKQGGKLQTEKNNDYILHDLFLHDGHQNAGPIFYRIRGIIQELSPENSKNDHVLSEKQKDLFDGESEINKKLQELAAFRNALMHGFFKLPAKRNEELVEEIQAILEKLLNHYELFKHKSDFHFWKNEGFSGHWNIQDNDDWNYLSGKNVTLFEKLASLAKDELHSPDFVKAVSVSHEPKFEFEKKADLEGFISSDFKESLYVQFHPRHKQQQDEFYESTYALLKQKENVKLLSYTINENGIGYTSYLLIYHLLKNLGLQTNENDSKKKIKSNVAELKRSGKKMVILINNIHLVPFASDHITSLMKFFKESEIHFIGIGWEYEHLNSIFSQKLDLRKEINTIPDATEIDLLIKNHTRHRGPYQNEKEYDDLKSLIYLISDRLKDKKPVIARQLADEEGLDIELINEALYILYPYFKYDQSGSVNNYLKDELDELYGFPKNQTETSSIFLTLGRRDIELEYKHKILKP